MSDRSDEVTESRDTDDLLEETEDLLSDAGVGADTGSGGGANASGGTGAGGAADGEPGEFAPATDSIGDDPVATADEPPRTAGASETDGRSRLGSLRSRLTPGRSPGDYFSPRAFLAFVLLVGAGLIGGGMAIPIAGRVIGVFAVAFAVGLLTSKRRYLEMTTAGTLVGGVSALASHAVLAVAGSFQAVVAVGVAVGLVASLLGYYFGRDLRNGLTQEIE